MNKTRKANKETHPEYMEGGTWEKGSLPVSQHQRHLEYAAIVV